MNETIVKTEKLTELKNLVIEIEETLEQSFNENDLVTQLKLEVKVFAKRQILHELIKTL